MCSLFLAEEFKERKGRENRSSLIYPQHVLFYYQVIFCKWVVQLSSLLSPEGWKRERWRSMGPARPLCARSPRQDSCDCILHPFVLFFNASCLLSYPPFSQFLIDILNTISLLYLQLLRRKCIIMFCISTEKSHQGWWELRLNVGVCFFFFLSLSSNVVGCCALPPTGHVEQGGACATGLYSERIIISISLLNSFHF